MDNERHTYIKSFFKKEEANNYLDDILSKFENGELEIEEASIKYVNHQWRVGVIFNSKYKPNDSDKLGLKQQAAKYAYYPGVAPYKSPHPIGARPTNYEPTPIDNWYFDKPPKFTPYHGMVRPKVTF